MIEGEPVKAEESIHGAFIYIQRAVSKLKKDGVNPAFKSEYITLDAMLHATKEACYKLDFSIRQDVTKFLIEERYCIIEVTTALVHITGMRFETSVSIPSTKIDAHGIGSAITYAKRYSLANLLAIGSEIDDDGNNASGASSTIQAPQSHQRAPQANRPIQRPTALGQPKTLGSLTKQANSTYSEERDPFLDME